MGDEKEIGILYTKLDSKTLETIGPLWDEEPGNNCQQKPNEGIQNKQNIWNVSVEVGWTELCWAIDASGFEISRQVSENTNLVQRLELPASIIYASLPCASQNNWVLLTHNLYYVKKLLQLLWSEWWGKV